MNGNPVRGGLAHALVHSTRLVPTPVWRDVALDLPFASGPQLALGPLQFDTRRYAHDRLARGLMLWVAAALQRCTDAAVSFHVPPADEAMPSAGETFGALSRQAGPAAHLAVGRLHDAGTRRRLTLELRHPSGRIVSLNEALGPIAGAGARRLVPRLADALGAIRRPDADPLPAGGVVDALIPCYADAADLITSEAGATSTSALDRRRDRIDHLLAVIERYPAEPEPRLLALGTLARLARAGSPVVADYESRLTTLAGHDGPSVHLETLLGVIRSRVG